MNSQLMLENPPFATYDKSKVQKKGESSGYCQRMQKLRAYRAGVI